MTIYRGFDITPANGGFTINGREPYPALTEVFATEEEAMDHIDRSGKLFDRAMRKAARLAQA